MNNLKKNQKWRKFKWKKEKEDIFLEAYLLINFGGKMTVSASVAAALAVKKHASKFNTSAVKIVGVIDQVIAEVHDKKQTWEDLREGLEYVFHFEGIKLVAKDKNVDLLNLSINIQRTFGDILNHHKGNRTVH